MSDIYMPPRFHHSQSMGRLCYRNDAENITIIAQVHPAGRIEVCLFRVWHWLEIEDYTKIINMLDIL